MSARIKGWQLFLLIVGFAGTLTLLLVGLNSCSEPWYCDTPEHQQALYNFDGHRCLMGRGVWRAPNGQTYCVCPEFKVPK